MYSLKDILFESIINYKYFRPYNHDEIEYEIDEYFKNDYTKITTFKYKTFSAINKN